MDLEIRPYKDLDFDPVTILWRLAREKSLPDLERAKGHFFYEERDYFRDHILPHNQLWVAQADGGPAGVMAIRADFIELLYIHPDYWRRGVGRALLDHAHSLSPDHLWLYTLQINTAARAFYEKNGFEARRFGISPPPENEPDVEYHWSAGGR